MPPWSTRRSLLPVLKQAGVVDSGGKGLFYIMEGALRHVLGQPLDTPLATVQPLSALNFDAAMQDVEEGQDYEVVVDFFPSKEFELQQVLRPPRADGHLHPGRRGRWHVSHAHPRAARQTLRAGRLHHGHRHHHQGRHGKPHGADGRCQRPHEDRQARA